MHTGIAFHSITVCIQGLKSIPVCIWRSQRYPYAHGDCMTHNPRMHTEIDMKSPYAYGDQDRSPYAYGDQMNPYMHTGIACHVIPVCIRGFKSIPVCIWRLQRSPYAYGDRMARNPRMHTGLDMKSLLNLRSNLYSM